MSAATFAVHVLDTMSASESQHGSDAPATPSRPILDAIVGFRLTGLAPCSMEERLDGQARFIACLPRPDRYSPSVEIAYALHHIILPPTVKGTRADVSTVLLMRVSDWGRDPERLRALACDLGAEVHALLSACLPSYRFTPVTSDPQLARLIAPFTIEALVVIRPRWQAVSAHLALPVPLGGIPSIETLMQLMIHEAHPCMLSIGFMPVNLAASAFSTLATLAAPPDAADRVEAVLPHLLDYPHQPTMRFQVIGESEPNSLAHGEHALVQRWGGMRLSTLYQPFQLRVQLAASGRLSEALVQLTAAEFGGPSKVSASPFWSTLIPVTAAGAEAVVPRTTASDPWTTRTSDFATAVANLRTLRTDPVSTHAARYPTTLPDVSTQAIQASAALQEKVSLFLSEMASLASLPEIARLAALPTEAAWLPAHGSILPLPYLGEPTRGVRIGVNTSESMPTPVHWPFHGRLHHAVVLGGTGMGKSTLLERFILDDILNGRGVVVIDPHDEMVERLLGRIPKKLAQKVILLDVADNARPLGINLLDLKTPDERAQTVTRFLTQLRTLYDPHSLGMVGPVAMMMLRHGMQAIMSLPHGGTLLEVYRLFTDDEFLDTVLPYIEDFTARAFFQQLSQMRSADRAEYVTHGISKLSEWVSDPMLQRIIAQRTSSFTFAGALNSGAIVLCQLRSGVIGADKAAFLGHLLIPLIYQAALSRLSLPPHQRRPASLYIDEAGTFTGDPSIARMLSECRKAVLSVNLIYQYVAQADPAVREAVLANAGSIFSFRLGPADAAIIQQLFAPSAVTAQALMQLPRGVAYSQIMLENGQRTPVFTLETELLARRAQPSRAASIREISAQRYGRARADVEAALDSRRDAPRWIREGDALPHDEGAICIADVQLRATSHHRS